MRSIINMNARFSGFLSINSGGVKLVEEKCDNNKKQIYFCIFLKLNH